MAKLYLNYVDPDKELPATLGVKAGLSLLRGEAVGGTEARTFVKSFLDPEKDPPEPIVLGETDDQEKFIWAESEIIERSGGAAIASSDPERLDGPDPEDLSDTPENVGDSSTAAQLLVVLLGLTNGEPNKTLQLCLILGRITSDPIYEEAAGLIQSAWQQ